MAYLANGAKKYPFVLFSLVHSQERIHPKKSTSIRSDIYFVNNAHKLPKGISTSLYITDVFRHILWPQLSVHMYRSEKGIFRRTFHW